MKDLVEPGKAHNCLNGDDSIKRYPKVFSIALVLTFFALVAFAAFLVSDILSLESNSSHAGSISAFSILNPPENGAAMNYLRDEAANHTDQDRDRKQISALRNESTAANMDNASSGSTGMNNDSSVKAESQLSSKSTSISKAAKKPIIVSTSSDGDSHKSFKKKTLISSKGSPQVNQGDASPSKATGGNHTGSDQSPNHDNLSDNLTQNLSAPATKIADLTNIFSASVPKADLTPDNRSSEPGFIPENFVSGSIEDKIQNTMIMSDESAEPDLSSDAKNEMTDNHSIPSEPDSQVASGSQPSSRVQDTKDKENKKLSNRDKSTKSSKKPTPKARPARTKPTRPARDKSK
jgi:hypothetical protein